MTIPSRAWEFIRELDVLFDHALPRSRFRSRIENHRRNASRAASLIAPCGRRTLVGIFFLGLGLFPTGLLGEPGCPSPPRYALLRQDEDYSYLRDGRCRSDAIDPIKYIPLSSRSDQYVTLGGELREWYEGFRNASWGVGPQDRDGYLLQRVSIHSDWHLGDGIRLFGQLSSAMVEGRQGGPRPVDEDRLWLEQAFAEFDVPSLSGGQATIRLGRQEFQFGSGRFVDVREGPNVRRAFDGVSGVFDLGVWHTTAFITQPVLNRPRVFDDPTDTRTTFWGVYAVSPVPVMGGGLDLYYLGINNRQANFDRGTANEERHNFGVRAHGEKGSWDYDWELTYQTGQFGSLPLRAYAIGGETGYTFKSVDMSPRISLTTAVTSGDGAPGGGTFGTFSPLFPSGIYFGEAAIGLNGPSNMLRLGVSLKARLSETVRVGIDYDWFWRTSLYDGVYGLGGNLLRSGQDNQRRYVGDQISASIVWQAARHVDVTLAYAYFLVGPFLNGSPTPGRNVQYGGVFISLKF